MAHSILLVEDDVAIGEPLCRSLRREGYELEWKQTGREALAYFISTSPDLVLLDLTLPDLDGLELCRRMRNHSQTTPIVMCTARAEEIDIVVGFESGADDYITKPFSLSELKARLRARLRLATPTATLTVGELTVDELAYKAWFRGVELVLTPKEYSLLVMLVSEVGRVVPRMRIMQDVWDEHYFGSTRTLDMHISSLRKKLDDDAEQPKLISTIRGVGFRYEVSP
jgi:DNA-binding response OmpR family regulator